MLTIVLAIVLVIPSFVYMLFRSIKHKGLAKYFYKVSFSLDQLGNVACGNMMNDWMIKPNGHRFGEVDETISHVMGKNIEKDTLYKLGKGVAKTIDFFAYLFAGEKTHCLNAAKTSQINITKN